MMSAMSHQELSFGSWTEGIVDDCEDHGDVRDDCSEETLAESQDDDEEEELNDDILRVGDHVYTYSNLIQQRHGIILFEDDDGTILIADFLEEPVGARRGSEVVCFRFRREHKEHTRWRKVSYGVTKLQRAVKRPGTATCDVADPPSRVLERIDFLMTHYHLVPPKSATYSNSQTLAFWCTTGQWRALQLNHLMDISNTASVVGTGSVATYAAAEGAGLCCLLGAELAVAAPLLLPAIAIGSLAAGGATVWNSSRMRKEWQHITEQLNREFGRAESRRGSQELDLMKR